jgi:hypothetical protein
VVKAYQATRAGNIDKHEFRFGDYWEQAIAAAILEVRHIVVKFCYRCHKVVQ